MTSLKDPYPLPPEEQKRLSEIKFDNLNNEVKVEKIGYNIRPWPWFFGVLELPCCLNLLNGLSRDSLELIDD